MASQDGMSKLNIWHRDRYVYGRFDLSSVCVIHKAREILPKTTEYVVAVAWNMKYGRNREAAAVE